MRPDVVPEDAKQAVTKENGFRDCAGVNISMESTFAESLQ